MEDAKIEANKSSNIAIKAQQDGDQLKAIKFFEKAYRIHSDEKQMKNIQKIRDTMKNKTMSDTMKQNKTQTKEEKPTTKPQTAEQDKLAKDVLKTKDFQEALGIDKSATEKEITSAQRKKALKLHPDKNTSPSAGEAFKKLSTAFANLSDKEKKDQYDRMGHEMNDNMPGNQSHQPEDIFNMFVRNQFNDFDDWGEFGGTFFNGQRVNIRRRTNGQNGQHNGPVINRGAFSIPPILIPIILIVLFNAVSLFSGLFEKPPVQSLNKSNSQQIYRNTKDLKMAYYVKKDFKVNEYTREQIADIEDSIEYDQINFQKVKCSEEKMQVKKLKINQQQASDNHKRMQFTKLINEQELAYCDKLDSFLNHNKFKGRNLQYQ